MAVTYEFYELRANEAAAAAAKATLNNVRERELRAEKTWRDLANQSRAVATQRQKLESEKAAERERVADAAQAATPELIPETASWTN
ncbi:MAG: hypothetical protein R3E18_00160 [Sphingomonadaceae bacterium]|nr:hypothetical protein [Sphingomonadaceae bacterium]